MYLVRAKAGPTIPVRNSCRAGCQWGRGIELVPEGLDPGTISEGCDRDGAERNHSVPVNPIQSSSLS